MEKGTAASCYRTTGNNIALGGNTDHRHQPGFQQKYRQCTSTWPLLATQTMNFLSDHSFLKYHKPQMSILPSVVALAVENTASSNSLDNRHPHDDGFQQGLGLYQGPWIATWTLGTSWTKEVFQGHPVQKMDHSPYKNTPLLLTVRAILQLGKTAGQHVWGLSLNKLQVSAHHPAYLTWQQHVPLTNEPSLNTCHCSWISRSTSFHFSCTTPSLHFFFYLSLTYSLTEVILVTTVCHTVYVFA